MGGCGGAAPGMAAASSDLAGVEVALLLADTRGHVIERWAPARTALALDRLGAAAGFVCSEAVVGTNSIGGTLRGGSTSVVLGLEHFADGLTAVSCASGALTDPLTGRLLGVVNMTATCRVYSPVMPALIGRIVHETQQRLIGDSGQIGSVLHAAFLKARRRVKGPIAVLDERHTRMPGWWWGSGHVWLADHCHEWLRHRTGSPAPPCISVRGGRRSRLGLPTG
jgi:transcriptional regulator of acetoin/glycerol metabolism